MIAYAFKGLWMPVFSTTVSPALFSKNKKCRKNTGIFFETKKVPVFFRQKFQNEKSAGVNHKGNKKQNWQMY